MIEMENISKVYQSGGKPVQVLRGISLSVDAGEFISIMGPSGSGKSTLASILGCLSSPSSGTYLLGGQDVTKLSADLLAKLRNQYIGYIFQDFNLIEGLSAIENVALPLVYGGVSARQRKARARHCLALVGLDGKLHHRPNQLSGGQKQRVAIARALVNDPKLLFADEPTGALDKKTGLEILGILQRLNARGHTIVQVTHSPQDASYSKRILQLVDGVIVGDRQVDKPSVAFEPAAETVASEYLPSFWRVFSGLETDQPSDFIALKMFWGKVHLAGHLAGAAAAIAKWAGPEAQNMLSWLFEKGSMNVRAEVLRVLPDSPFGFNLLLQGLRDESPWVRTIAINELRRCPADHIPETAIPDILIHLTDQDERVRSGAVTLLGIITTRPFTSELFAALQDPDGRVRANAIEALSLKPPIPETDQAIRPLLDDRFNRARANAAVAIAKIDFQLAFATLRKMVLAPESLMRASGAWGLGALNARICGELLLEILRQEKEEIVVTQITRSLTQLARGAFSLDSQITVLVGDLQ